MKINKKKRKTNKKRMNRVNQVRREEDGVN